MPIKDKSKYPRNWNTEIRPAILTRAEHRCEQCRAKNGAWVCRGQVNGIEVYQYDDGTIYRTDNGEQFGEDYVGEVWAEKDNGLVKIVLTIAHLDHDTENNDYSNLKALCQLHHLRHDIHLHRANAAETRRKNKGLQNLF